MTDSTSTQRTHRYLRIAIGGTVVVILVAMLFAVPTVGWLASISDYFYTPARNAFVGALIAASLALLALSGRGAERTILDAAALFAPLIALVPTVVRSGSIPGVDVECGTCVPLAFRPDVANGVATYLVILAGVLMLAIWLSIAGQVQGARFSIILGASVLVVVLIAGLALPDLFLDWTHFLATILFFGLIAADAILNAFWRTTSQTPLRWLRIVYIVIAVVLVVDIVVLIAATIATWDADGQSVPWILVGEAVALLAFLAFWWLQTWQRWNETDPASLVPMPGRLPPLRQTSPH
ncbi:hypothetical protein SAMN04487846_2899 [Microbacterium sp. cf046]|uniref:hypothetical protein n=1 Tax=Microbacterium sp. cf046 TaxID=1761803 RepID=UPI0008DEC82B|nr:hypothetical protein [Microbacterium sp. cf046]SFS14330.1 hypothetical protein SAMN04487846_2899 [Microbacterium sp. cf046]